MFGNQKEEWRKLALEEASSRIPLKRGDIQDIQEAVLEKFPDAPREGIRSP
jgi:5-formaminoimidazole-4-carboxamide-1-beta-D-ribofuranosyl 5'-monophosphate synthetase